jgi:site-specific DNA recombinase
MGRLTLNVLLSFSVRAGGHVRADQGQDRSLQAQGTLGRRSLPLGHDMKDGKITVVEHEAEQVRLIYRRYLELSGVNDPCSRSQGAYGRFNEGFDTPDLVRAWKKLRTV